VNALRLPPNDGFREVLEETVAALSGLIVGDPAPFNALWSHADDVTVVGGFGGYERGWERVKQNAEAAASRFTGGRLVGIELVTLGGSTSGDLAFSVWIEHFGDVRVAGREESAPLTVRVTHIFRREEGAWKLIHRHGDQVAERT
jgi:ketosteroid isomerase-like protein